MVWQKVLKEPETVLPLGIRDALLELHEKKWTWFACQSLRPESVFEYRKFSFFATIQGTCHAKDVKVRLPRF